MFLPVLHGGEGYPTGWLYSDWRIDPTVPLVAFVIGALYILYTGTFNDRRPDRADRPVTGKQRAAFLIGCVIFIIALGPPLDDWSDKFLLTAHMFQHMLLLFAVAPLWLYATPGWLLQPLADHPVINRIGYAITRPVPAALIANAIIIVWHIPGVYDLALRSEPVHIIQHGAFLVAGLIAWWPVLGQLPAWPILSEPVQCLYLALSGLPGAFVGAVITFAGVPFYHFYESSPRIFGMTLEVDQQAGGLLMWVGGSTLYLLWISNIFLRWGRRMDEAEQRPPIPVPSSPEPSQLPSR